jgi:signal transduction histidine kinase
MDAVQLSYDIHDSIIKTNLSKSEIQSIGSFAAVPLTTEGFTLGALFLGARRQRAINENHTELMRTVAHQIALAIRNTQLYFQLEQMVVLQERHRLSREFHDGLAQTLGYLNLQSERIENLIMVENLSEAESEIQQLRETVQDAYNDIREAIDDLRLSGEDPGLITGQLSEYLSSFSRQTGIKTVFSPVPKEIYVEPTMALQIQRIAQEALTNVRKHAQAQTVEVFLREDIDTLQLIISDNGVGFPVELKDGKLYHSYGLTTMRERSEGLGGTITIATSPNEGTRITVNIPIKIKTYD